jgi:hypothetical protein
LLITAAHIATDFWSIDLMLTTSALYRAGWGHWQNCGPEVFVSRFCRWKDEMLAGPEGSGRELLEQRTAFAARFVHRSTLTTGPNVLWVPRRFDVSEELTRRRLSW